MACAIIASLVITIAVAIAVYKLFDGEIFAVGVAVVVCVLLSGMVAASVSAATRNPHWQTCTVTGKDRGKDSGSYRIYTKQCDTLADEDSWINGKHNSSNLYGQIEVGHTYEFRIVGYRSGIGSHFANILDIREAPAQ